MLAIFTGSGGGFAVTAAVAQEAASASDRAPDFDRWEQFATTAENALEAGDTASHELERLREQLTEWRERFLEAQSVNAGSIATVQRQLEALGPAPEEGGESREIALEREHLNARLTELQAPGKRAELAYSRADGLIRSIDQTIRDRQTEALLQIGPSPVNPVHWPDALSELYATGTSLMSETRTSFNNAVERGSIGDSLPVTVPLFVIGLVLITKGRRWSRRLSRRILRDRESAGRWIAGFVVSLGSFALPYFGLVAISVLMMVSGLLGQQGEQLLQEIVRASLIFLVARWLATRVFPAEDTRRPLLDLEPDARLRGRWYGASLGLLIAALNLGNGMREIFDWSEAAGNVILFPAIVIASLLLWRLGRLLGAHARSEEDAAAGEEAHNSRLAGIMTRTMIILAVLVPVLGAAGYFSLAKFLLFPSLLSLMLIAALLVLQRVVLELYALLTGNVEGAAESLIPVMVGFVLVLLSMPLFALIWGARVADLTELWTRFVEGVSIGGTRISPTIFLTFALVFALGYLVTRLTQGALKNSILPKTRMDPGGRNAIVAGVGYLGIFLAAIIAITSAGIDLSSLAIVAGALSVGIGFGLQNIVSNFVSGIILLIERPISEGDWIEVGGQHGYVRDISVRSTRIETFDRTDVIVPNADFVSGTVTNYTRGNTVGRVIVPVGVSYGTDTRKVEKILQEIAEAHPMVLANPKPAVVFQGFGDSSMDFEIRAILRDVNFVLNVRSDMNHEIARRFAEEGVEIPFPQQDLWLRNPETLRRDANASREAGKISRTDTTAHLNEGDLEETERDQDAGQGEDGADGGGDGR
ncbi:MAG: DUF3772 domain-containing protein [Pseudomonadota bacterium]|uniref:DUF3772 domain-containing protein n=1 Tax=Roseovarius TaxID=74030 RepID=UPI003982E02A